MLAVHVSVTAALPEDALRFVGTAARPGCAAFVGSEAGADDASDDEAGGVVADVAGGVVDVAAAADWSVGVLPLLKQPESSARQNAAVMPGKVDRLGRGRNISRDS